MKGFYPIIKYNTTRNNFGLCVFKRIKFIRNLNKTINISFFNIQKSIIKVFIISLSHYIRFISIRFLLLYLRKFFEVISRRSLISLSLLKSSRYFVYLILRKENYLIKLLKTLRYLFKLNVYDSRVFELIIIYYSIISVPIKNVILNNFLITNYVYNYYYFFY